MKKLAIIFFVTLTFFSCKDKKLEQEAELLRSKNQELLSQTYESDSLLADYMQTFNDISTNLNEIRSRESSIEINSESPDKSVRDRVTEDIQIINDLMQQNKEKITELDKKLKGAWYQNSKLKKSLDQLKEEYLVQIESKDTEIVTLKEDLEQLNFTVEELNANVNSLTAANEEKDAMINENNEVIEQQTTVLNTAYYAFGTVKKLVDEKVLSKEGGFLGLGKSKQFTGNYESSAFNEVDITETTSFEIAGKKPQLITTHPNDSYKFEESDDISSLIITDPEKFWNSSKYLVVAVN
ncbi:MAG: hypothetical protein AAGI07_14370 [Bacteroidota bacterium]